MAIVKDLIEAKKDGSNYSIEGTESVLKAIGVMASANISAVLITEEGKIVGIFTERDYIRKGELQGICADKTQVKDLMTKEMITVTTDTSVEQCTALMMKHNIRHLPIVDENQLVGVLSMRDVIKTVLADRESTIIGLENYILGSGFAT
ncbi:MAG: CBS domain-containing protein [Chloroflexi bacterium]|nr:CBS domain-containing protein [Chloroflexota bacterium]